MTFQKKIKQNNRGFTLTELLVTVAVLTALLCVAVLSFVSIQRRLTQKALDSKAEIIYVAAQKRLVDLRTAGFETRYSAGAPGVEKLGYKPADSDTSDDGEEGQVTADTLYYIRNDSTDPDACATAFAVMDTGSMDDELRMNSWLIEYDPVSGSVYSVFYSEKGSIPTDPVQWDTLRYRKSRLNGDARVGYYGGDVALADTTDALQPWVTIENEETLTLTFHCITPAIAAQSDRLTFTIVLTDSQGNTFEKKVTHDLLTQLNSRTYRYIWVLDSLERTGKTRFVDQTKGKLVCGSDIQIRFTVSTSNQRIDSQTVGNHGEYKTNSLFAYRQGTKQGTALISYGRHLQNLNEQTSRVTGVDTAIQISDISFRDDPDNKKDWYTVYQNRSFEPITNSTLTSYIGRDQTGIVPIDTAIYGLTIRDQGTKAAGLFRSFSGTISDVTLTGVRIDGGSNVGALVGEHTQALTLHNCRSFLSSRQGDLSDLTATDSPAYVQPWIHGKCVGGLVGCSNGPLTIGESLAAAVLKGSSVAGGLVGNAYSQLSIERSYADCYLQADYTGGLIGGAAPGSSVSMKSFYAVGYQVARYQAAGLALGQIHSAQTGYAAVDFTQSDSLTIYSTATYATGKIHQVYFRSSLDNTEPLAGTIAKNYKQLCALNLGEDFTFSTAGVTYPYNLMAQGLSDYSYPRLTGIHHYGDWLAEFEDGALVYYEYYPDGSYGFSGANADTLSRNQLAIGDGYALVYSDIPLDAVTVTYASGVRQTIDPTDACILVESKGMTYYLYPLMAEHLNAPMEDGDSFYQKLLVGDTSYYFNPHFAKTGVASDWEPKIPEIIYLRSARHLYALSQYYSLFASAAEQSAFRQELNMDYTQYQWHEYANRDNVSVQKPINSDSGFRSSYDGRYHWVKGISLQSDSTQIGLFGSIARGKTVQNLFLTGIVGQQTITYQNQSGGGAASGSKTSASLGALAGVNYGTIRNCAVSGYSVTYYGYRNNVATIGGLVGSNQGTVTNCSADAAGIELATTNASAYVGGFVGTNQGSVANCYSLGRIQMLDAQNSTVQLAGFVGSNTGGVVRRCYAAVALIATGSAESYGFGRIGGVYADCLYLDGGTYAYANSLYAYNTSTNVFSAHAAGTPCTGEELKNGTLSGFGSVDITTENGNTPEDSYSNPGVVKDGNGQIIHMGNWPVQENIGTLGVFYWELESHGSNSGYHFSYIGTSEGREISGNSLCTQHDDGGYISAYGYGYFYKGVKPTLAASQAEWVLGQVNDQASYELGLQMPGYTFVAYQTGEGSDRMHLISPQANGTWILQFPDVDGNVAASYSYDICPFFADSMSLRSVETENAATLELNQHFTPGTKQKPYQIRSVWQLQFINWNYGAKTTGHSITANVLSDPNRTKYPYLAYSDKNQTTLQNKNLNWVQSHDIDSYWELGSDYDATQSGLFTPIGSLYDDAGALDTAYSNPYAAYFDSSYNGQAYVIKNIEIRSTTQCLGLFGITSGAQLRNIILYSDKGNHVWNLPKGGNWYCVGGLVGLAGSRDNAGSVFENCTVSGYQIIDQRSKGFEHLTSDNTNPYSPGWGGGCVGGLVGATNMNITRCTAVTDIQLDIGYCIGWKNLRAGGIAGVCRGTVNSCYAGGSIVSPEKNVSHNQQWSSRTSIWVGGIVGGIVMRDQGTLMKLIGSVTQQTYVKNSYSFVQMPAWDNRTWIMGTYSIASNGEMQMYFSLVQNPTMIIQECYTLQDTAMDSEDYKRYKKMGWEPNWSNWNMNAWENGSVTNRAIRIQNSSNPFLSYEQMTDGTLRSKLTGFGTVTVTEYGANIDGKYTFPGDDAALQGLNYPFPTILTQKDVFGNTVNVHYGPWPKSTLYWEKTGAELDLLSDATEDGALLRISLYADAKTEPTFTFFDDDDEELTQDTPVKLVSCQYNKDSGCYDVVFSGQYVGIVTVQATQGGQTAKLDISVTAKLDLQMTPTSFSRYEGEGTQLELTVTDAKGDYITEGIIWDIQINNGDSDQAVVECDPNEITVDMATGTYTLPISCFAAGEATVTITCLYPYQGGQTLRYAQQSVNLVATTKLSDVLGVANVTPGDKRYQQVKLLHTPDESITSYTGSSASTGPEELGLYLYATRNYTDPMEFELTEVWLQCEGADYDVFGGKTAPIRDRLFQLGVGYWPGASTGAYSIRTLTLNDLSEEDVPLEETDAVLKLVLRRGYVRYILTIDVTLLLPQLPEPTETTEETQPTTEAEDAPDIAGNDETTSSTVATVPTETTQETQGTEEAAETNPVTQPTEAPETTSSTEATPSTNPVEIDEN